MTQTFYLVIDYKVMVVYFSIHLDSKIQLNLKRKDTHLKMLREELLSFQDNEIKVQNV